MKQGDALGVAQVVLLMPIAVCPSYNGEEEGAATYSVERSAMAGLGRRPPFRCALLCHNFPYKKRSLTALYLPLDPVII